MDPFGRILVSDRQAEAVYMLDSNGVQEDVIVASDPTPDFAIPGWLTTDASGGAIVVPPDPRSVRCLPSRFVTLAAMTSQSRNSLWIAAPPAQVFDVVAHIDNFMVAVPAITDVEYLTGLRRAVGTRFRQTRVNKLGTATNELEVVEYQPPSRVRLVADEGGTVWDTTFTVAESASGSTLTMVMDARPHTVVARIVTPVTHRVVARTIASDLDAVKEYCEQPSSVDG